MTGDGGGFTGVSSTLYFQSSGRGCAADPYTTDIYAIYNTASNFLGSAYLVKFNSNREFVSNYNIGSTNSSSYKYVNIYFAAHGITVYNFWDDFRYAINGSGANYPGNVRNLGSSFGNDSTFIPISTNRGVYFVGKNNTGSGFKMAVAFFDPSTKGFSVLFTSELSGNYGLTAAGSTGDYAFVHVSDTSVMAANEYLLLNGNTCTYITSTENLTLNPWFYYSGRYYMPYAPVLTSILTPKLTMRYFTSVPSTSGGRLNLSSINFSIYGGEEKEFANAGSVKPIQVKPGLIFYPVQQKPVNQPQGSYTNNGWWLIDLKHQTGGFSTTNMLPDSVRTSIVTILFLENDTSLVYNQYYTPKENYPKFKVAMTNNITPFGEYYIKT